MNVTELVQAFSSIENLGGYLKDNALADYFVLPVRQTLSQISCSARSK